jgi:hypothetical protein
MLLLQIINGPFRRERAVYNAHLKLLSVYLGNYFFFLPAGLIKEGPFFWPPFLTLLGPLS